MPDIIDKWAPRSAILAMQPSRRIHAELPCGASGEFAPGVLLSYAISCPMNIFVVFVQRHSKPLFCLLVSIFLPGPALPRCALCSIHTPFLLLLHSHFVSHSCCSVLSIYFDVPAAPK